MIDNKINKFKYFNKIKNYNNKNLKIKNFY